MDWEFGFLRQIEIATIAGACFALIEVRGISVKPEVHGRGFVLDESVRMSGCIIEKLIDAKLDVGPRAGRDGRGNGADSALHGVVNCTSVVVEDTGELLTKFELGRGELASGTGWFCKLLFLTVGGRGVGVWRVLWFLWLGMAKSSEGFGNVVGH